MLTEEKSFHEKFDPELVRERPRYRKMRETKTLPLYIQWNFIPSLRTNEGQ